MLIVAASSGERNQWMDELRVRVAPWQLLQRRKRHISLSPCYHASVEGITNELKVRAEGGSSQTVFQDSSQVTGDNPAVPPSKRPIYLSE